MWTCGRIGESTFGCDSISCPETQENKGEDTSIFPRQEKNGLPAVSVTAQFSTSVLQLWEQLPCNWSMSNQSLDDWWVWDKASDDPSLQEDSPTHQHNI